MLGRSRFASHPDHTGSAISPGVRCPDGRLCRSASRGFDRLKRPRAPGAIHPRAQLDPTPLRSLGPAMFTMQAFQHAERTAVHHFVGHDSAISADRATHRLHCAKSRWKWVWRALRNTRLAAARASVDREGRAGSHTLDAIALRRLSFAQPLSIPRAGQALAPPASGTKSGRRRRAGEIRLDSILRSFFADLGRRFDSSHFMSLQPVSSLDPPECHPSMPPFDAMHRVECRRAFDLCD